MEVILMPAIDTGYGVKGLIVCGQRGLLLQKPNGEYDLPGGRLKVDEGYREGLDREIQEETGLRKVQITDHFISWTFINPSGAVIKGRTLLCLHSRGRIRLSDEHAGFSWKPLEQLNRLNIYRKYGLDKFDLRSLRHSQERRNEDYVY
jgi:ADP-ribose pyrophosphatase YjhB (NUDIX family)